VIVSGFLELLRRVWLHEFPIYFVRGLKYMDLVELLYTLAPLYSYITTDLESRNFLDAYFPTLQRLPLLVA
jgi:hypothetical protein